MGTLEKYSRELRTHVNYTEGLILYALLPVYRLVLLKHVWGLCCFKYVFLAKF